MMGLGRVELANAFVRLVPLREASLEGLVAASRGFENWTLTAAPYGKTPEEVAAFVRSACKDEDAGMALPFAVLDARSSRVLGSSRFTDIVPEVRAELGYTWYERSRWGTAINPACKRLMLAHAFEAMGLERVYFYVRLENERSLAAVARLGAIREGMLRHERRNPDGTWRDTVVFSILRDEWPGVRDALDERLRSYESPPSDVGPSDATE